MKPEDMTDMTAEELLPEIRGENPGPATRELLAQLRGYAAAWEWCKNECGNTGGGCEDCGRYPCSASRLRDKMQSAREVSHSSGCLSAAEKETAMTSNRGALPPCPEYHNEGYHASPPAPDVTRQLVEALEAVKSLIENSRGVVGLHLNEDEAPWEDLLEGGQFEEWLKPFSIALAAHVRKRKDNHDRGMIIST